MKKFLILVLSVIIFFSALPVLSFASTQQEKESNNTIKTANSFNIGNSISGYISKNDVDFFKFTLTTAGKVTFNIKINAKDYLDDGWFSLYNGSGAVDCDGNTGLCSFDDNLGYITEQFVFMLQPGTYYAKLKLSTSKTNVFSYSIMNSFVSSNSNYFEPDNYVQDAHTFTIGKTITGQIDTAFENDARNFDRDYDYYVFSIPSTLTVTFLFTESTSYHGYKSIDTECVIYKYNSQTRISDYLEDGDSQKIKLAAGKYYIKVVGDPRGYSSYSIKTSLSIPTPTGFTCIARNTSSEKVSWNRVTGVSGYQVQCSDGGTQWAQTKSGNNNTCTFSGLTAGGKYKFRVRAYIDINGTRYYGAWAKTLCSCAKPASVTIKSVSSPNKKQIKTNWAKAGGVVTGYQIVYSRNKAFTNIAARKNISGKSTVTYTGKNFTRGKTYYVAVRAYTTFSGQVYYGKYSTIKAIKCK